MNEHKRIVNRPGWAEILGEPNTNEEMMLLIDYLIGHGDIGDNWKEIRQVMEKPYKWDDTWQKLKHAIEGRKHA